MSWIMGSPPVNESGIQGLLILANNASNGYFGILILFSWLVISIAYLLQQNYDARDVFLVSTFSTFVLSVFVYLLDLINQGVIALILVFTVIAFVGAIRK